MNKTLQQACDFADALLERGGAHDDGIARFVVPPFTAVREVAARLAHSDVRIGAQTMHWDDDGAWTGEISAPMLRDCGLHLVELGHSERRAHFGETDHQVGLKVRSALKHGLQPLICIGETRDERDAGDADAVLERQVDAALAHVAPGRSSAVLFAYEPVWAIGEGGSPAGSDYADARQARIKHVAAERLGAAPTCLYGGSVRADNCAELIRRRHIDGLFIGRAAWHIDGYLDILARCRTALESLPPPSSTDTPS